MNIVFSCVVDKHPKFRWQCHIFIQTLTTFARVQPEKIYVHLIDGDDSFIRYLESTGVNIIQAKPWGDNKHCNKLTQIDTKELTRADYLFLCDCDIAFTDSVHELAEKNANNITACTVHGGNPPLEKLQSILTKYKIPHSAIVETYSGKSFDTNCNGGFLGFPPDIFRKFGKKWRQYAKRLLTDEMLLLDLGGWRMHVDQISFCMALNKHRFPFKVMPAKYNIPLSKLSFIPEIVSRLASESPIVLHYHANLDEYGLLKRTNTEALDNSIENVNALIGTRFRHDLFWDLRYALNPDLGSGLNSRGVTKKQKVKLLRLLGLEKFHRVLDVGCGDGEVISALSVENYTGVDTSPEAIQLCKKKLPRGTYFCEIGRAQACDVVVCLDVLVHQNNRLDYDDLIKQLVAKTKRRLIVSGFDQRLAPPFLCHYFENLRTSLLSTAAFRRVYPALSYDGQNVLIADKQDSPLQTEKNRNDIDQNTINTVLAHHQAPDQLLQCINTSRAVFGWFTKHYTRTFEYPWLLKRLDADILDVSIAEFGAGISPLPLILSMKGAKVFTVDYGPHITLDEVHNGTEWGFFDYAALDRDITCVNAGLTADTFGEFEFDVWFSVSVIEHMAAEDRRRILKLLRRKLAGKGRLLLTVDLKKDSSYLWNRNAGKEVESFDNHGTLDDLLEELRQLEFGDIRSEIVKMPVSERVDIATIEARAST